METCQQLRVAVHSIIDGGFVQTAVAGARIGGDILEAEGLNYIQHKVRSGTYGRQCSAIVDSNVRSGRRRLFCAHYCAAPDHRRRTGSNLEKLAAIDGSLFGIVTLLIVIHSVANELSDAKYRAGIRIGLYQI